jgi:hypothetical protein
MQVVFPHSLMEPSSLKLKSPINVCELFSLETNQPVVIQILGMLFLILSKFSQVELEFVSIQ